MNQKSKNKKKNFSHNIKMHFKILLSRTRCALFGTPFSVQTSDAMGADRGLGPVIVIHYYPVDLCLGHAI